MTEVTSEIPSRETILLSLKDDPIFIGEGTDDKKATLPSVDDIMAQDSRLSEELHNLNNLKLLSSLIHEFNTNLKLLEVENCYYSLENLRKKFKEKRGSFTRQSLRFQRSVTDYMDSLHLKFSNLIYDIMTVGFWHLHEDHIGFSPVSQWDQEKIEFEYDTFTMFLRQQLFPNNVLDSSHWLLSEMEFGDAKEAVRHKLSLLLKDYIQFSKPISLIKSAIISGSTEIEFRKDENSIYLKPIPRGASQGIEQALNNFKALNEFLMDVVPPCDRHTFFNNLGRLLSTELTDRVKSNASVILGSQDSSLKSLVTQLNEQLIQISKLSDGDWNFTGTDIQHLLNDSQLYINLLVDKLFNQEILEIRKVFNDKSQSWRETTIVDLPLEAAENGANDANDAKNWKPSQTDSSNVEIQGDDEDTWNWDVDKTIQTEREVGDSVESEEDYDADNWNEQIDVSLDDLDDEMEEEQVSVPEEKNCEKDDTNIDVRIGGSPAKDEQKVESVVWVEGDDEDDEWKDEWGISDIDENENTQGEDKQGYNGHGINTKKTAGVRQIKISTLPRTFKSILSDFNKGCADIGLDKIGDHYLGYKFNLLQTTFYAMAQLHYKNDWPQFYVDMRYLCQTIPDLDMLEELASRYLETCIAKGERKISRLIQTQLKELLENESNPKWDITYEQLVPAIQSEIVSPLSIIGGKEADTSYLTFMDFLFNKSIVNIVLKWETISEKDSEHLAQFISSLLEVTENASLNDVPLYKEYRAKVELIARFLPLHLKDIMNMFYEGDFYLFSTEEIIQWVKLLFADTPLREGAISEIYEIRAAATDEN